MERAAVATLEVLASKVWTTTGTDQETIIRWRLLLAVTKHEYEYHQRKVTNEMTLSPRTGNGSLSGAFVNLVVKRQINEEPLQARNAPLLGHLQRPSKLLHNQTPAQYASWRKQVRRSQSSSTCDMHIRSLYQNCPP